MGLLSKLFKKKETPAPPEPNPTFNLADLQMKTIMTYKDPNDDYKMTKKQMEDFGCEDEIIYQYDIDFWCELVKNGSVIKVVDLDMDENEIYIGRIADSDFEEVSALMDSGCISAVEAIAEGGKYKVLREDYDRKTKKYTYTVEKGETDYSVKIELLLKKEAG